MSIQSDFKNGFMPKERAIKFINNFKNLDLENIEFENLKKLTIKFIPLFKSYNDALKSMSSL